MRNEQFGPFLPPSLQPPQFHFRFRMALAIYLLQIQISARSFHSIPSMMNDAPRAVPKGPVPREPSLAYFDGSVCVCVLILISEIQTAIGKIISLFYLIFAATIYALITYSMYFVYSICCSMAFGQLNWRSVGRSVGVCHPRVRAHRIVQFAMPGVPKGAAR